MCIVNALELRDRTVYVLQTAVDRQHHVPLRESMWNAWSEFENWDSSG